MHTTKKNKCIKIWFFSFVCVFCLNWIYFFLPTSPISHFRIFGMRQRKWSQNKVKSLYLDKIVVCVCVLFLSLKITIGGKINVKLISKKKSVVNNKFQRDFNHCTKRWFQNTFMSFKANVCHLICLLFFRHKTNKQTKNTRETRNPKVLNIKDWLVTFNYFHHFHLHFSHSIC